MANLEYPTPNVTGYFRDGSANVFHFALDIAPGLARDLGRKLLIADAGCSKGSTTWTLAAVLDGAGVDFQIDGYEYHQELIEDAYEPIDIGPFMSDLIQREKREAGLPPDCDTAMSYDYEQSTAEPAKLLGQHVSFTQRDLLQHPLPKQRYDLVNCHHVLYHYKSETTHNHLLDNILTGIRPGGYFIREHCFDPRTDDPAYTDIWRTAIEERGLIEVDPSRKEWDLTVLQLPA